MGLACIKILVSNPALIKSPGRQPGVDIESGQDDDGGLVNCCMAETLGSLSDKLVTVKLKQYHTEDQTRLQSLSRQETQLRTEIDEFISAAIAGKIPLERLTFEANKVYKKEGNETRALKGSLGQMFAHLSEVNCKLWHVQETVYDFEASPAAEKDGVIRELAVLNLERNNCIDELDRTFLSIIKGD